MAIHISDQDNKSILTEAKGFTGGYHYNLNPYQGCAFGCQYCYVATLAVQDRQDAWGRWVKVKMNAITQMEQAVAAGRLDHVAVYMSTATDPYQPVERQYGITAGILQAMTRARGLHLVIQTRGPLADNPSDLAACQAGIVNGGRVQLNMTLTTNDEAVRKACEPTGPSYQRRLDTAAGIARQMRDTAGYAVCATLSPLLPTDAPEQLAQDLLDADIRCMIIQPAKPAANAGARRSQYRKAASRNEIYAALAELWGTTPAQAETRYHQQYRSDLAVIQPMLEAADCHIGYRQEGFAPPWPGIAKPAPSRPD